jgi:hypothetical protein
MNNTNEFNQFENIDAWVKCFEENDKLPKNKILCSKCKTTAVSMLRSSNLKNTLPKYNNDIRRLLTEFQCRDCRNVNKVVKTKVGGKATEDNTTSDNKPKKVSAHVVETPEEREARAEEIRKNTPKVDLTGPKMSYDLNIPEHVRVVTDGHCHRPDLYLKGNKACNLCGLYTNCACTLKRLK